MPTASVSAAQMQKPRPRRAARDVEGPIHRSILRYLRATLPSAWVIQHTPNKPRSKQQGSREKANGAIAGWPDLAIYGPGENGSSAWFAEIKPPGVTVPEHQRGIHDALMDAGFSVRVLRSVEDARKAVQDWRLPSNDSLIVRGEARRSMGLWALSPRPEMCARSPMIDRRPGGSRVLRIAARLRP